MQFLVFGHILLITLSNVLVQYPFICFGFHTTYGAFTYPAIFILTDLTTQIRGAHAARAVIFRSMIPGLLISYWIASFIEGSDAPIFYGLHLMPLRIACACFTAYVVGQLLDILVFQRYRKQGAWWRAPALSSTLGNVVDTGLFFSIAFYHCRHPFLNEHWPEIATVDMAFKILISLLGFVPIYGILLSAIRRFSHSLRLQA